MNRLEFQFEKFFGLKRKNGEPIFNGSERHLANLVYDVACDEIFKEWKNPDDDDNDSDSVSSFDVRLKSILEKFERVIELFETSKKVKDAFLKNFLRWSSFRKSNIRRLGEIAEQMQTYKNNSGIAKVVGGVVGVVGGVAVSLSFLTPLAAITAPLSVGGGIVSALGGGVVAGSTKIESALLKSKLEEAKTLAKQEEANFSTIARWFTHAEELKAALGSLVSYQLLVGMSGYLQPMEICLSHGNFKKVLKPIISKMCKSSRIIESFGVDIAPAVMTFVIVVCLLRSNNRVVLYHFMQTEGLTVDKTGEEYVEYHTSSREVFFVISVVIDALDVVLNYLDVYNQPESKDARKVRNMAEQLEKEFLSINRLYNALLSVHV